MFVDLICLIQDRPLELARLDEMNQMPTFNTLRISNDMKKVWKASEEFEEGKYVSNKLIFLFIDAHKFLGNELSPVEIVEAALEAHSADFDAHMTSVVFEALLPFLKAGSSICSSCLCSSSSGSYSSWSATSGRTPWPLASSWYRGEAPWRTQEK